MQRRITVFVLTLIAAVSLSPVIAGSVSVSVDDYSCLWWAYGSPYYRTIRPCDDISSDYPGRKQILSFHTGRYGLVVDTINLKSMRFGRFEKPMPYEADIMAVDTAVFRLPPAEDIKSSRPNIVIIFTDDQGYADLGCFGNKKTKTPRMDKLAREGTRFTSFYAQTVCGPSRSALLTGRYSIRSKGWDMPGSEVTFAEIMKEVGYQTACIGKWDVSNRKPIIDRIPKAQGFDYYFGTLGANDSGTVKFYENNEEAGATQNMGSLLRMYTDKSIDYLKNKRDPDKPLILYLAHTMMHVIIDASPTFKGKSVGGLYGDVVEEFDYETGRLLDALDELGLSSNTMVIYTSDNGPWNQPVYTQNQGKRGHPEGSLFWGEAGPLRNGKGSPYEGGYRVPCIVRWPGKVPAGRVSDAICATIDFLPTFAGLSGAKVPDDRVIDGIDQIDLLLGKTEKGRDNFYFERAGVRQGKWKFLRADMFSHAYARDKDREKVDELYDLESDLGERNNLASKYPEKVSELKSLYEVIHGSEKDLHHAGSAQGRPNVLFIAIDDMNDWTTLFDKANPIRTPNLERLAARGMFFTRGYCVSSACNPSRTAIMTGLAPATSGCYSNGMRWWKLNPGVLTLPQYFRNNGYLAKGAGKIYHHGGECMGDDPRGTEHSWDGFQALVETRIPKENYNGYRNGQRGVRGLARPAWDWGEHDQKMVDEDMLEKVSAIMDEKWDKPMFLAAGIYKPHLPFYAPPEVFMKYPIDDVVLPEMPAHDLDDVPEVARNMAHTEFFFYSNVTMHEAPDPRSLKRMVQCYQASADYADSVVGRLLDKLDATGRADNTIIVLWADHGYHLGDKESCVKFTLWEKANRVPFIIVAPGVAKPGSRCDIPVSLLDIYPTLLDLTGMSPKADNDGYSLVPLLKDPQAEWKHVPIMTMGEGNHAVRTARWRYIRYNDGSEELYDHDNDPWEWKNLAGDKQYAEIIAEHKKLLPEPRKDIAQRQ